MDLRIVIMKELNNYDIINIQGINRDEKSCQEKVIDKNRHIFINQKKGTEKARVALRMARDNGASDAKWQKVIDRLEAENEKKNL